MKTAVEWLENELVNSNLKMPLVAGLKVFGLIKKAKEMEKQQIIEAHGNKLKKSKDEGNYEYWFSGEDYYNKTFKNTKQ